MFETSVAHVEKLLDAEYFEYEDPETDTMRIGCDQYLLPEHISKHIDYITPGVALSVPLEKRSVVKRHGITRGPGRNLKQRSHPHHEPPYQPPPGTEHLPKDLRHCGRHITPACLRALYCLPSPAEVASSYNSSAINSIGVFEVAGRYSQKDLDLYFTKYLPHIPNGTHPIGDSIDGQNVNSTRKGHLPDSETEEDIMIMYELVYVLYCRPYLEPCGQLLIDFLFQFRYPQVITLVEILKARAYSRSSYPISLTTHPGCTILGKFSTEVGIFPSVRKWPRLYETRIGTSADLGLLHQ